MVSRRAGTESPGGRGGGVSARLGVSTRGVAGRGGPRVVVSREAVVGARGTGCCGEVISWGVTSKYVRCERLYCLDVLCPN